MGELCLELLSFSVLYDAHIFFPYSSYCTVQDVVLLLKNEFSQNESFFNTSVQGLGNNMWWCKNGSFLWFLWIFVFYLVCTYCSESCSTVLRRHSQVYVREGPFFPPLKTAPKFNVTVRAVKTWTKMRTALKRPTSSFDGKKKQPIVTVLALLHLPPTSAPWPLH